ncbi:MAG: hypothetical protein AAGH17_05610 [Pseudomonadota bacterium]
MPPDAADCRAPTPGNVNNTEGGAAAKCFLQTRQLPDAQGVDPKSTGWASLARRENAAIAEPEQYTLAFVELDETTGKLTDQQQLDAVVSRIDDSQKQTYVVTYVHGWRHDSSIGNTDVAKFRVILGYTRAALNTRCITQGTYCDAELVGVYVGWRGRSFNEPTSWARKAPNPFIVGAIPTLYARRNVSQDNVPLVSQILRAIGGALDRRPGDPTADKMLVFGHSLGGNTLTHLVDDIAADYITDTHQPGQAMPSFYSDLMVLINPASEARNWTKIQQAERRKVGLGPQDRILSQSGPKAAEYAAFEQLYPRNQRPVVISLTSTNDWAALSEADQNRFLQFDWATGLLFPIFKSVFGEPGRLDRTALGHLKPTYVDTPASERPAELNNGLPKSWQSRTQSEPLGASHEYALLRGAGQRTTYANAAIPDHSWCQPADGWLTRARQDGGSDRGVFFDWGLDENETSTKNVGDPKNPAGGQWRNRLYLKGHKNAISVAAPMSPFWNTRVLDNALRDHDGFQNYVMWCNINQIVLDDITRPTVAESIADELGVTTAERFDVPDASIEAEALLLSE